MSATSIALLMVTMVPWPTHAGSPPYAGVAPHAGAATHAGVATHAGAATHAGSPLPAGPGAMAGPSWAETRTDRPDPGLALADSLFLVGRVGEAFGAVHEVLGRQPDHYEALWRAASFAVALGVMAEEEPGERLPGAWYQEAEALATRGIENSPDRVEARYWKVAALGRQALSAGATDGAAMADRIREGALDILALDPEHPGAHNALGRLYYEIMTVSGVTRFLGRTFTRGRALDEASWPKAEEHLRRAVDLAPEAVLFRLDLARYLVRRGEPALARAELRRVVEEAAPRPPERAFAAEARELLREVEG